MTIWITWTEQEATVTGWQNVRGYDPDPQYATNDVRRWCRWSEDDTPQQWAAAQAYVAEQKADGDTRNLRVTRHRN